MVPLRKKLDIMFSKCNFLVGLSLLLSLKISAQNVGINITVPESALDVNGDFSLRSVDLTLLDGANLSVNINSNAFSNYRISGPVSNFSLSGLTAANDGRMILLLNNTDYLMSVVNADANAILSEQIITGTGGNLEINSKGSVTILYDGLLQKWIVKNYSSISTSNTPSWHLVGNSNTDENQNFIGTTDNKPVIIKSFGNTVAEFRHGFPSNNYIGTNYQRTGIGILGNGAPTHTLEVGLADINGGSQGVLGIRGTNFMSHFNYGASENTYIRSGKTDSHILLNDLPGLGNIGIGTSDPFHKLEVNGTTRIKNSSMVPGINGYLTSGGNLISQHNSNEYYILMDESKIQAHKPRPNFQSGTLASHLILNPFGGNIGIGTNYTPSRKLEIYNGRILFAGSENGVYSGIEFTNAANTAHRGYVGMFSDDLIGFYSFVNNAHGLVMDLNSGNIGVGTVFPSHKLSVKGTIRSQEVVVEAANWPDYVFADDYSLRNLKDVEQYIKTHRHLPGVPNAQEMETNGQHLGATQKIMMEKIEELTLYIIELKKEIESIKIKTQKDEK